jgi:hypothetical protein
MLSWAIRRSDPRTLRGEKRRGYDERNLGQYNGPKNANTIDSNLPFVIQRSSKISPTLTRDTHRAADLIISCAVLPGSLIVTPGSALYTTKTCKMKM